MKTKSKIIWILAVAAILLLCLVGVAACREPSVDLSEYTVRVRFDLQGGILNNGTAQITGTAVYAYKPNSLLIDINDYYSTTDTFGQKTYNLKKSVKEDGRDYNLVFDGWYLDEQFTQEWNFATDLVTKDVTLYAKWRMPIVYSYSVHLVVGEETTLLGTYDVDPGKPFNDYRKVGTDLSKLNRTFINFYEDKELTKLWTGEKVHQAGPESVDIPVYVKSIEGVWTLVATYDDLKYSAESRSVGIQGNIMLTGDIDCGGKDLCFNDFNNVLQGKDYNGVSHTISNFNLPNIDGTSFRTPKYSIFKGLGAEAVVENVRFTGVTCTVEGRADTRHVTVAALAQTAEAGAKVSNVSVSGSYQNLVDPAVSKNLQEPDQLAQQLAEGFAKAVAGEFDPDAIQVTIELTLKQNQQGE